MSQCDALRARERANQRFLQVRAAGLCKAFGREHTLVVKHMSLVWRHRRKG